MKEYMVVNKKIKILEIKVRKNQDLLYNLNLLKNQRKDVKN